MKTEQIGMFLGREDITVVEAMQKIDLNAKGILFITDDKGRLLGTITDGDIRRWLIKTGELHGNVNAIMNSSPKVLYRKNIKQAQAELKRYAITALPVINPDGRIVDIVFKSDRMAENSETEETKLSGVPVVIMAGGKGTRLYPYTKILPKPLIPIGDIPIMERIINRFAVYGVREYYATLNYRRSMIKSYFSDIEPDYTIRYVEEDKPLGTAGSLHLIQDEIDVPFIVTNCDILIQADYADIYRYHQESGNEMTMVTALKNIIVPYGVVKPRENGVIQAMEEKPRLSYFVNTGMYILNPELLKDIPQNSFYHMTDLADELLKQGRQLGMYPISEDSFLDMGEFEEMHRMEKKLNLKSE